MSAQRARTRPALRASLALLAAMACLAGCGTMPYPSGAAARTSVAHRARHARTAPQRERLGPPGGNRTQAAPLAASMLTRLVLPAGARSLPARTLPRSVRQSDLAQRRAVSVDLTRLFRLPVPMAEATAFLQSHAPAGFTDAGGGTLGRRGVPIAQEIDYALRRLPRDIFAADLFYTVVPARGGAAALLGADAQVIWYPSRTAAEYVQPASFRSVSITVSLTPTLADPRVRTVQRTIRSRAVIAALAKLLDSLHAWPPWPVITCPLSSAFWVTFNAADSHHDVAANGSGCPFVYITVGSAKQPALYSSDITSVVNRLRRIVRPYLRH